MPNRMRILSAVRSIDAVHARLHGLAVHPQSAHPDHAAVLFGLLPLRLHAAPAGARPAPAPTARAGKGFGHIVVRAHLKPHNPAGFLILRGEDDNGRGADFRSAATSRPSISGSIIEQDHVVFVRNGFFQPGRSVLGNVEGEPNPSRWSAAGRTAWRRHRRGARKSANV